MSSPVTVSLIIPVFNASVMLEKTLSALAFSTVTPSELIVVDDGSTDNSAEVARRHGAQVISTPHPRSGPACARNRGASVASADVLCFLDADCIPEPDTLARIVDHFQEGSTLDAVFGVYGDRPTAPNFVAQYKNLFHRFIHRTSNAEASSFWAGCGAIRRTLFLQLGGFDALTYSRPTIEDIDLGLRLKERGGRILLDSEMTVQHQKAWTLATLIRTDVLDRAIPWTRLMLSSKRIAADLNLRPHHRASALMVPVLLLSLAVAPIRPVMLVDAMAAAGALLWLNRDLYRYFRQLRGPWFTLRAIPLHWLYYLYSSLGFGMGVAIHLADLARGNARRPLAELPDSRGATQVAQTQKS